MLTRTRRPRVFLSFAGNDRPMAIRLAEDLCRQGIDRTFIDVRDIEPGASLIRSVSQAISASDYCVLLWSRHCVDRPYVELEIDMAYARQLSERRSFLFVVTLDETPLPPELSIRRYLDGRGDWNAVAATLARHWRCDLATGTPVYPAPSRTPGAEQATVAVLVRNEALGMTHVIGVAADCMGEGLLCAVREALALPECESQLKDALRMRFHYRLFHNGHVVSETRIDGYAFADGALLDLEVHVQVSGPDGPIGQKVYRSTGDALPGISDRSMQSLVRAAFKHLMP